MRICEVLLSDLEQAGLVERDQEGRIAQELRGRFPRPGRKAQNVSPRGRASTSPCRQLRAVRGVPKRLYSPVFRRGESAPLSNLRSLPCRPQRGNAHRSVTAGLFCESEPPARSAKEISAYRFLRRRDPENRHRR
jgi:hypothetical protein